MLNYPKVIEVQFHNKCNSNCLICPYKDMNYSYKKMADTLFEKILDEVDENKLKRIIPYLNNEPFLDSNFIDKVKKIRNKFKKIEIEKSLMSNGLIPKRVVMSEASRSDLDIRIDNE